MNLCMKQKVFSWGDRFTVWDENGNDRYYVCGDSWTVREIEPSTGYLLNDTVYEVGASPARRSPSSSRRRFPSGRAFMCT